MKINDITTQDINEIEKVASNGKVLRVAMCKDNVPYLVLLNYGYEFNNDELLLYCNCDNCGKKLDILNKNPYVFVEINSELKTNSESNFSYFSIMSLGKAEFIYNIYDKIHGLNKITQHYTLNNNNEFKDEVLNKIPLLKITCKNLSIKKYTH